MLVHSHHLAQVIVVLVFVVMIVSAGHALHRLLLQKVHAVHHPQAFPPGLDGGEDGVHPGVGLASQIDEEVAVPDPENISRGGLIGVAFRAGGQQQGYIPVGSGSGSGEVIGRKNGGHDLQPPVLRLRRRGGASAQQRKDAEQGKKLFHKGSFLLRQRSDFPANGLLHTVCRDCRFFGLEGRQTENYFQIYYAPGKKASVNPCRACIPHSF